MNPPALVTIADGPFSPEWPSLENYHVPEWYEDAKLGIFIHWGVYSVPAFGSEWYPRHMYQQGSKEFEHHVKTFGSQDKFGYKDFIPQFTAPKFNPDEWAAIFKDAGAQYVVPVAEHHDGFAMYATKLCRWNSVEMGPKRDVIGQLFEAFRKVGLTACLSSHRAEHWWFLNGGKAFESDVQNPELEDLYGPAAPDGTQPTEAFLDDWLARCCELVDLYQPQLFYFDWWIEQPAFRPYLKRFAAHYYNRGHTWGKGVAINYKNNGMPEKSAIFDVERGQLEDIRAMAWQTCTANAKNSWGYVEPMDYKSSTLVIHDLIDIVSKTGRMLLNVGPHADGSIPDGDKAIFSDLGAWLKENGEAIYGTRPWKVYGEGPSTVKGGGFTDEERSELTSEDIRFTTKNNLLYALVLGNPETSKLRIKSLGKDLRLATKPVATVHLVSTGEKLKFLQSRESLEIDLPDQRGNTKAIALRIGFGD